MTPRTLPLLALFALVHLASGCAAPVPEEGGDDASNALSGPPSSETEGPGDRGVTAVRRRFRDAYLAASTGDFVPTAMPQDENGRPLPSLDESLRTITWAPSYEYFRWRGQSGPSGGQVYTVQARNYPAAAFSSELRDARGTLTVLSIVDLASNRLVQGEVRGPNGTVSRPWYADATTILWVVWPSDDPRAAPRFFAANSAGYRGELRLPTSGAASSLPAK
jgi:hypothetical protein